MAAFCLARASSFSTWLKVAVCAIISLLLAGLAGSWYFIWATRSLRKTSFPSWSGRSTDEDAGVVVTVDMPLTGFVMENLSGSDPEVQATIRGSVDRTGSEPALFGIGSPGPRADGAVGPVLLAAALTRDLPGGAAGAVLRAAPCGGFRGGGGDGPAGVTVDLEAGEAETGGLQVAAQVGE